MDFSFKRRLHDKSKKILCTRTTKIALIWITKQRKFFRDQITNDSELKIELHFVIWNYNSWLCSETTCVPLVSPCRQVFYKGAINCSFILKNAVQLVQLPLEFDIFNQEKSQINLCLCPVKFTPKERYIRTHGAQVLQTDTRTFLGFSLLTKGKWRRNNYPRKFFTRSLI